MEKPAKNTAKKPQKTSVNTDKKSLKKRLVVLDTHAIIHRAYHAIPDFTTHDGKPTGALYGLSTMIMRIIADLKPDYMVAAYDLPQKTFRHEAYEAYKGTRQKTDDILVTQLIESREVVEAFGIPILDAPGFEADDVIGTIAHKLKNSKTTDLIIASGDMDTMQLVNNSHIFVYTLKKTLSDTILYNEDMVVERYGFKPEFIVDYKGLRGDTSDNIIGIAGIGEKTATILIQTYGSIESMYKALKKDFADFRAKTGLSERLANLIKDNQDEAIFSKTLATIRHDAPVEFNINECDFRKNIDTAKLREVFTRLEFRSLVNKIDDLKNGTNTVSKNEVLNTEKKLEAENAINAQPVPKDIALMTTLIYSDYIDPSWDDVMQVAKVKNHDEVAIREVLLKRMTEEGVLNVYKHIEEPLIEVVDKMEKNGIKVNVKFLQDLGKKYHTELDSIEKSIFEMVGTEFNINSPKQLGEVLFDKLELNKNLKIKKSAGGKISTRESELEKMRDLHPAIAQILEYRELQKLLSTYLDVLPTLVDSNDRIHATFNQIGAVTGRFSSKNPNLQNIPIKTERGRVIRDAFIAEDGYSLVVLDYAQVELRLAAVFSQDVAMLDAFNNGKDIHTVVAAKIFHVPESEVTKNQRRSAKTINFGILYGMGVNALREGLGSSRVEAQEFYDAYYKEFATLANYLESVKAFARENGFTQTLFGRKRIFNSIKSPLPFLRAQAERMAINAPIQGTQADMTKLAMIAINSLVQKKYNDTDVKIVLQVHDELVYEVKDEITSQFLADAVSVMSGVVPESLFAGRIPVKFDVSGGIAKDWGSVK
jgi:DNA polymerase-1